MNKPKKLIIMIKNLLYYMGATRPLAQTTCSPDYLPRPLALPRPAGASGRAKQSLRAYGQPGQVVGSGFAGFRYRSIPSLAPLASERFAPFQSLARAGTKGGIQR